jgi:hypothetical protein
MTGYAFQCLVTDDDVWASLRAVRRVLRPEGRFVFETRHPQAQAWLDWNPYRAKDITGPTGRPLRVWHRVESVKGELVSFATTTADPDGTVFHVDWATLRFLPAGTLSLFLTEAGFELEAQYGDWHRGPLTHESLAIVTVARRPAADLAPAATPVAGSSALRRSRSPSCTNTRAISGMHYPSQILSAQSLQSSCSSPRWSAMPAGGLWSRSDGVRPSMNVRRRGLRVIAVFSLNAVQ